MKSIISKYFKISILTLLTTTIYSFAETNLPVSTQLQDNAKNESIEVVPEIKIEAQSPSVTNSNLKEGKACNDNLDNLEEAKGELFVEIPMAKTIPCDTVDCQDLAPARLLRDNYKKLNDAKTLDCGE